MNARDPCPEPERLRSFALGDDLAPSVTNCTAMASGPCCTVCAFQSCCRAAIHLPESVIDAEWRAASACPFGGQSVWLSLSAQYQLYKRCGSIDIMADMFCQTLAVKAALQSLACGDRAAFAWFANSVGIAYNTDMAMPQIVLDTNVLISAQRSRRGASSKLLSLFGTGKFEAHLSVALVLEYEEILMRHRLDLGLSQDDVSELVDALCALSKPHEIHYQWRPYLRDPDDEFVLDLAIATGCDYIVSFNRVHFVGVDRFGIRVVTPGELLQIIGEAS